MLLRAPGKSDILLLNKITRAWYTNLAEKGRFDPFENKERAL